MHFDNQTRQKGKSRIDDVHIIKSPLISTRFLSSPCFLSTGGCYHVRMEYLAAKALMASSPSIRPDKVAEEPESHGSASCSQKCNKIQIYTCVYIHILILILLYMYIYIYICTYTYTYRCMIIHTYDYIFTYIHMCIRIYIYT